MESASNNLMITQVQSVLSTHVETEDMKILQALNLNLQVKVHNLETDVDRLKKEVQAYKGKNNVYESLSQDLSSLRKQFDKTAVALLQKCEAYETLKKEVAALKAKSVNSPRGVATPIRPKTTLGQKVIPVGQHLKRPLFRDLGDMDFSSDDDMSFTSRRGRPSMGSCGNIANQIASEEAMPSRMKAYAAPTAPLRNRILMKLHSIKSASTESLESTGRKSLRKEEASVKQVKPSVPMRKPRTNNVNPSQPPKFGFNGSAKATPAPAYRPALGQSNGQRMVRIANIASVKRSSSNCSTTSAKSSSSRPAFRF